MRRHPIQKEESVSRKNSGPFEILESGWVARQHHAISRKNLPENVLKVLYRLNHQGWQACLVGGAIRDILSNQKPKDFDIATNASPYEVRKLFRNSRIIGRRFKLVHVFFGQEIIEISTFRKAPTGDDNSQHPFADNAYGTLLEDEKRRDFTVNAMYYDIKNFALRDGVGARKDLEDKKIRLIGDPDQRFQEDPARMLRAVRFAARLDAELDALTLAALKKQAPFIRTISPARLFDEWSKLLLSPNALAHCALLQEFGLMPYLIPGVTNQWSTETFLDDHLRSLPYQALLFARNKTQSSQASIAFLMAAFLWERFQECLRQTNLDHPDYEESDAFLMAMTRCLSEQRINGVLLPKMIESDIKETWSVQKTLNIAMRWKRLDRVKQLVERPQLPVAVDFLHLLHLHHPSATGAKAIAFWQRTLTKYGNIRKKSKNPIRRQCDKGTLKKFEPNDVILNKSKDASLPSNAVS